VLAIHASARTGAALAYRARVGVTGPPRVAVVVQRLVEVDCAGVLFTRDPVSAADERVIEASWGLGEAVVSGRVDPDRWRMRRGGQILSRTIGEKDVELRLGPRGGLEEVLVDTSRRAVPCLSERNLLQLEAVAARCEAHFPGAHDVEWALWGDELFLLQRRAVTR
ncbi:MAG: PEP/pyruvate-binding domain-containing protein, partial [Myxococcales bacterium]